MDEYKYIKSLTIENLDILFYKNSHSICLDFLGKSSFQNPKVILQPILFDITNLAQEKMIAIILNFSDIEYLNSSSLGFFVKICQFSSNHGIAIEIVYNHKIPWQDSAFQSLCFLEKISTLIKIKGCR